MPRFGDFLAQARRVQVDVYGQDAMGMSREEWATYVTAQFHAAHVELGEAAQELPLRSWRPQFGNLDHATEARDRALVEMVDVLCFVSNVLVALDVDDDELNEAYDRKVSFTRTRDGDALQER